MIFFRILRDGGLLRLVLIQWVQALMKEGVARLLQTCSNQPHGFTSIFRKLKDGSFKDAPHNQYKISQIIMCNHE